MARAVRIVAGCLLPAGCLLLVSCLLLAGCTAGPGPAPAAGGTGSRAGSTAATATPAPVQPELTCAGFIGTDSPPAPLETVLGVVALPTSPRSPALQTSRNGAGDGSQRLFAKTGLAIRAGATLDLTVPDGTESSLGIGWGPRPSTPARHLHVPACPDAGGAGWLSYPGGYWLDRPACVSLLVTAGGQRREVRIGLGTPCPGQQPPQGPSDR